MGELRPHIKHDLMNLAPGIYRCCLCFDAFTMDQLAILNDGSGMHTDVCLGCAEMETASRIYRESLTLNKKPVF